MKPILHFLKSLRLSLVLVSASNLLTVIVFAQSESELYLNLDSKVEQILQDIGEYARLSGMRNNGAKSVAGGRDLIDIEGRMLELSQKIRAESAAVNNESNQLENGWRIRNRLAGSLVTQVLDQNSGYGNYGARYEGNFSRPSTANEQNIVSNAGKLSEAISGLQDKAAEYAKLAGMKRTGAKTFVSGTLKALIAKC